DYNQDLGIGADGAERSFAANLESAAEAYLQWADEMRAKFPQVIFETCASGGMRTDYKTLSHFSLVSTSDQTNYLKYAYIAANVLSAVLPEQAAVWSYPVDSFGEPNTPFEPTAAWAEANISRERVVFNMIDAFLGRMHLASHLELLSEEKFSLVKEGVAYYEKLSQIKKTATPIFPKGLCSFGDKEVTCGLKDGNKIYLAVWNLSGEEREIAVPINAKIRRAEIAYPAFANNGVSVESGELKARLNGKTARFFEIEIQAL
ncbi:MAG: alpha-galactosidase, partial [Candidatus Scatosoma sp.]